jgi:hypothetical protein
MHSDTRSVTSANSSSHRKAGPTSRILGRVDGFDEDEAESKGDKGPVVLVSLLAAQSNALEPLELSHGLLDASSSAVERLGKELRLLFGRRAVWNRRADTTGAGGLPVGLGVITLVAHSSPGRNVRPEVEQRLKERAVAGLTASQAKAQRIAIPVGLEMDLGREAPTGAAQRLPVLPPFAPAAETWARTMVESNICTRWAVSLSAASASKKGSNTPVRLRPQNRFQTEFQLPKHAGSAR